MTESRSSLTPRDAPSDEAIQNLADRAEEKKTAIERLARALCAKACARDTLMTAETRIVVGHHNYKHPWGADMSIPIEQPYWQTFMPEATRIIEQQAISDIATLRAEVQSLKEQIQMSIKSSEGTSNLGGER